MNCNTFRNSASEYLDGMLSDEQKKNFEAHLNTCSECQQFIQQMRQMLRYLSAMEEEELPEGFRGRLYERLQAAAQEETSAAEEPSHFISEKRWLKWGAGLAAAIVLLLSVRLAGLLDGEFPGSEGALPDVATEQDWSEKLSSNAKMAEEPAQALGDIASASSDGGNTQAEGQASEDADVPMMISAGAPEEFPIHDTRNADNNTDILMFTAAATQGSAGSGEFNLYVRDASAVLRDIAVITADIGITVIEENADTVVLQITDEVQITALYSKLAELGRVEDLEIFNEENTVTVHVITEK